MSRRSPKYVNVLLPADRSLEADPQLIDLILEVLDANPGTHAAIQSAGGPRYVTLSQLDDAPPYGAVLFNDSIGVLSVPRPRGGSEAVRTALADVVPGLEVEEEVKHRAQ